MPEYAKYMDDAWRLHKNATLELNWWDKLNGGTAGLRAISAQAWEAVSIAACVLLESRGVTPPPERRARRYAFHYLEKKHPDIRERRIGARLGSIGSTLYTDCFYDGDCRSEDVIRSVTEEVPEFIQSVAELLDEAEERAWLEAEAKKAEAHAEAKKTAAQTEAKKFEAQTEASDARVHG